VKLSLTRCALAPCHWPPDSPNTKVIVQGLTAVGVGRGNDDAWRAAQDKLATLSTNSRYRIVADATHASLVDQTDAPAVSQAIRDVVAVQSDQPLASR
jgi:hypothetical protein